MKCPRCGGERLLAAPRDVRLRVGDDEFAATVRSAQLCEDCGAILTPAAARLRFERAVAVRLAQSGARSPEAFKLMRRAAGLKSVELARLFSVEPETVSRWESGARPLDLKAAALLGSIVLEAAKGQTATRQRLEAMQQLRAPRRWQQLVV